MLETNSQSPLAEIAERVSEAAPGLVAAAHLSALDDWRRSQRDFRQRVRDGHALQNKALGADVTAEQEEPMGNLVITGDIYGNNSDKIISALAGGPTPTPPQPTMPTNQTNTPETPKTPPQASGFTWGKAGLLAAALLAGTGLGAGIPWLAGAYNRSGDTTNISTNDQALGVEVVPGGADQ